MNKQQFVPDPGIEGMSAFDQAVQSGNLQALNIPKIFKGFGEAFGVFTPKKKVVTYIHQQHQELLIQAIFLYSHLLLKKYQIQKPKQLDHKIGLIFTRWSCSTKSRITRLWTISVFSRL